MNRFRTGFSGILRDSIRSERGYIIENSRFKKIAE